MAVKRYEIRQPNGSMATFMLNDADAKRLGVFVEPKKPQAKKAAAPANKARTSTKNKG